jgi:hypothetical protein
MAPTAPERDGFSGERAKRAINPRMRLSKGERRGPVVANGMVFMTSGNGGFVGHVGNVPLGVEVAD